MENTEISSTESPSTVSIPPPCPVLETFRDYANYINWQLLEFKVASTQVLSVLDEMKHKFPIPLVELVPKGNWDSKTDVLLTKTHRHSHVSDAIRNVEKTGRRIGKEEYPDFELLLTHWCGWCPTSDEHMNDDWMNYLRAEYLHLGNLVPVLDSLTWPDELREYPPGIDPIMPFLFLLATSDAYYV